MRYQVSSTYLPIWYNSTIVYFFWWGCLGSNKWSSGTTTCASLQVEGRPHQIDCYVCLAFGALESIAIDKGANPAATRMARAKVVEVPPPYGAQGARRP